MPTNVSVEVAGSGQPLLRCVAVTTLHNLQEAALAKMQEIAPVKQDCVCQLLRCRDSCFEEVQDAADLCDGDELQALRTELVGDFEVEDAVTTTIVGKWAVFGTTANRSIVTKDLMKVGDAVETHHNQVHMWFSGGVHSTMGTLLACNEHVWRIGDDGKLASVCQHCRHRYIDQFVDDDAMWCTQAGIAQCMVFENGQHVRDDDYQLPFVSSFLITCWEEEGKVRILRRVGKELMIVASDGAVLKKATLPNKIPYVWSTFVQPEYRCVTIVPDNAAYFEVRDVRTLERVGVRLRKGKLSHIRRVAVDASRQWLVALVGFCERGKPVVVAWELATGKKYVQCRLTDLLDRIPLSRWDRTNMRCQQWRMCLAFVRGCSTIGMTLEGSGCVALLETKVPWTGGQGGQGETAAVPNAPATGAR